MPGAAPPSGLPLTPSQKEPVDLTSPTLTRVKSVGKRRAKAKKSPLIGTAPLPHVLPETSLEDEETKQLFDELRSSGGGQLKFDDIIKWAQIQDLIAAGATSEAEVKKWFDGTAQAGLITSMSQFKAFIEKVEQSGAPTQTGHITPTPPLASRLVTRFASLSLTNRNGRRASEQGRGSTHRASAVILDASVVHDRRASSFEGASELSKGPANSSAEASALEEDDDRPGEAAPEEEKAPELPDKAPESEPSTIAGASSSEAATLLGLFARLEEAEKALIARLAASASTPEEVREPRVINK